MRKLNNEVPVVSFSPCQNELNRILRVFMMI
jgi:hypothetical protein